MTERIDHAAEAQRLIESAYSDDPAILDGIRAVAHAQLALVEQQRIANMQTERAALRARADGRSDLAAGGMEAQAMILDLQIREGLGLA